MKLLHNSFLKLHCLLRRCVPSSVIEIGSPIRYCLATAQVFRALIARSSNGRTRPSGGRYLGSSPSLAAVKKSIEGPKAVDNLRHLHPVVAYRLRAVFRTKNRLRAVFGLRAIILNMSDQFTNPKLVGIYDAFNSLDKDRDFWVAEIERLAPKTIIDLGCGTGLLTCELASKGYDMIGVEPAAPMLDIARQKEYADQVQWVEGGYEKFDGLKADLVLMTSHVAQFFYEDSEWNKMLSASYKALNPGGHILFDSRQHLKKSFETWPTETNRRRKEDPTHGPIEWWCKLLNTDEKYAHYELHYLFLNMGEEVISSDKLVFRSEAELRSSLEATGFSVEMVYGDWDGSLLTEASPEMLFLGIK